MKLPSNLTPEDFKDLLEPVENYHNSNEMLGHLTKITNNLQDALYRGQDKVTSEVLGVLVDLGNLAVTGSQSYMHKGNNK